MAKETKKEIKKEDNKEDLIKDSEIKEKKNNSIESNKLINDVNEKKEEISNSPENSTKKQNKQVIWAVVLMVAVILIILLTPYMIKNYVNKFTYIDLDFYKTKMGEITFYSTIVPVTDKQMSLLSDYPLNFRNDPRKLDKIPYKFPMTDTVLNDDNNDSSQIIFKKSLPIYISIQSDAPRCEDNMIAVVGFTKFLKEFANLNVKAATDNKTYANETGYPYITCNNHPTNTVMYITSGNSTEIIKIDDNCYELIYNNCEITQVTERFMLEILKGYMRDFMKYFKRY